MLRLLPLIVAWFGVITLFEEFKEIAETLGSYLFASDCAIKGNGSHLGAQSDTAAVSEGKVLK